MYVTPPAEALMNALKTNLETTFELSSADYLENQSRYDNFFASD